MTPAQAAGVPSFVTDVPVQGPTDEGLRAADCYYTQKYLPANSACADCGGGPIPMWAKQNFSYVRGPSAGIGEAIFLAGAPVYGMNFALSGPNDDVWATLTPAQQAWVADTMRKLNDLIVKSSGTTCPGWNPSNITSVTTCFKGWFNANYAGKLTDANGQPVALAPTTVFDQQTLDALITITGMNAKDFPTPFPGSTAPSGEKKGLSKGAMYGIIGGSVAALGSIVYLASNKKKSRRSRR